MKKFLTFVGLFVFSSQLAFASWEFHADVDPNQKVDVCFSVGNHLHGDPNMADAKRDAITLMLSLKIHQYFQSSPYVNKIREIPYNKIDRLILSELKNSGKTGYSLDNPSSFPVLYQSQSVKRALKRPCVLSIFHVVYMQTESWTKGKNDDDWVQSVSQRFAITNHYVDFARGKGMRVTIARLDEKSDLAVNYENFKLITMMYLNKRFWKFYGQFAPHLKKSKPLRKIKGTWEFDFTSYDIFADRWLTKDQEKAYGKGSNHYKGFSRLNLNFKQNQFAFQVSGKNAEVIKFKKKLLDEFDELLVFGSDRFYQFIFFDDNHFVMRFPSNPEVPFLFFKRSQRD